MSSREQHRFYAVAEVYQDDERVMAFAVVEFLRVEDRPELIYRDLLACRYLRWIDQLEQIVEEIQYNMLQEWCQAKAEELNALKEWCKPDVLVLEHGAWRLGKEDEE